MIQTLGLLGMYFDAAVVEVKTFLLLFISALVILYVAYQHMHTPTRFKNVPPDLQATRPIARGPFKNRMANYSLCYC